VGPDLGFGGSASGATSSRPGLQPEWQLAAGFAASCSGLAGTSNSGEWWAFGGRQGGPLLGWSRLLLREGKHDLYMDAV
jgi:hypothetical protein